MLKRKFTYENLVDLLVPLVCILLGFIVGMILIAVAGKNPFGAYFALFQGAFGSLSNISESVLKTSVLVFTGLSVGLAYRVGLFNIGAEGQFIIGAISAAFIGHWVRLPAFLHIPLIFLFAMITSGIWALIAGWLKVSRGVHEVISTIMLNWVAYYLVENWLVVGPMAVQGAVGSTISEAGTPMIYPTAKLWRFVSDVPDLIGKIFVLIAIALVVFFLAYYALKRGTKIRGKALWFFSVITTAVVSAVSAVFVFQWQSGIPGIRMNIGIFFALAAVVIIYFLLFRTVLGYEIRAIGFNNQAAKYAGINVKRNILLTMFLAGALSGLGGVLMVCGTEFRFPGVFPGGYGFDGIAMALIGQNSPFGILLASILFGIIRGGSTAMQLPPYKIHKTFADIIQGSVVLFISAYFIIQYILMLPRRRREV